MVELRDGDRERYRGLGVRKAVENVIYKIAPEIIGMDSCRQREIDYTMIELDGTDNKGSLGANAILGVSLVPGQHHSKSLNTGFNAAFTTDKETIPISTTVSVL